MTETAIRQCPKCAAAFDPPVPGTEACPRCGVYFFKLASPPAPERTAATGDGQQTRGRGWIFALLAAGTILAATAYWRNNARPHPPAPEISTARPPPASTPLLPAPTTREPLPAAFASPERRNESPDPVIAELRGLHAQPDAVFSMQDEVYRIANTNDIRIASIQFYGQEIRPPRGSGTGTEGSALAFAETSLQNGQPVCDIRIIRPDADLSYRPGQATTRLVNLMRRAILAHELSHCVDWANRQAGLHHHAPHLPPTRDALSLQDIVGRWGEEFAELHGIVLLRNTYGEDTARQAMQLSTRLRKDDTLLWYKHAWHALASGEALNSRSIADSETLIVKYWGR